MSPVWHQSPGSKWSETAGWTPKPTRNRGALAQPALTSPIQQGDAGGFRLAARMRALEAYIYAQRSGTPIAYGKR